ncbi:MAG: hypothetical protein LBB43_07575 [Spirochaetaceae bacterium]|nr:hypothetical protein [Spirochaetaceae bacterium]
MTKHIIEGMLFFISGLALFAQELPDPPLESMLFALRDRAVILSMITRVIDDQTEIWNSSSSKVTIPGRAVGLKIVGDNVVVTVQFTPYLRQEGPNILVVQGQIWVDIPDLGIQYQTTIQTIPLEFGERVYFLPLGNKIDHGKARIEIQLELLPYTWREPKGP